MRNAFLTLAVLAPTALVGCAEESNTCPALLPLQDTTFRVNEPGRITVRASDTDGDPLSYSFTLTPEPRTQTMGAGRPQMFNDTFSWTPGIADAGDGQSQVYALTLTVSDDRGCDASETISLTVVDSGVGGSASLRFIEPPGAGVAVDLTQRACVDDLEVRVKADAIPDQDVEIYIKEPVQEGMRLTGSERGKKRTFFWCPNEEQLDRSLSHSVTFCAREVGGDVPVCKSFSFRFQRTAAAAGAGAAPLIEHNPPGAFSGPLNYELEAVITDDVGFKEPPYVLFTVGPDPGEAPDTSGWQTVNFASAPPPDGRWVAAIPNLNLPAGQTADVWYQVVATDNDDPDGTRCDHTARSGVFSFVATGGEGGGGSTYGFCEACVADDQCGGPDDRCMLLRGESFCGRSCAETDCSDGQQCYDFESIDGVVSPQCLPVDLNCGQLCVADMFEADGGNNESANPPPVEPGRYDNLSICAGDNDFFAVPLAEGQSIRVTASFDNDRGDLDLAMALQLPGDAMVSFDYQSLNGDVDSETVHEPCAPATLNGEAVVLVFGYEGSENTYDLDIEVGPGDCAMMCQDDGLEDNDTADDFTAVELPFERQGLQVCRRDPDYYGFEAQAGDIISVSASFLHVDGDIDMRLYRGGTENEVGRSLSYRDAELIELEAPMDDVYIVEIYGATRSVANRYALAIETRALMMCQSTLECPVGTYCAFAGCSEDACEAINQCAGQHGCVTPRAGLDPAASGGRCAAFCQTDRDCRQGFDCKRFEDFTQACAPAGAAGAGERCGGYHDCAGDQVCYAVPGGYCATGGCDGDGDCPAGTVCGELQGFPACLKRCDNDGDCRAAEDYTCRAFGGSRGCAW